MSRRIRHKRHLVYAVYVADYETSWIIGLFDSIDKAEQYKQRYALNKTQFEQYLWVGRLEVF